MEQSTFKNVKVKFSQPGTYPITLKVSSGGLTTEKTVNVVIKPSPITFPVETGLFPPEVNFTEVAPNSMPRPDYRVPVEETSYGVLPDGKKIITTRVTDGVVYNKINPHHHFSRTCPWNTDETRAIVSGHLLDATNKYSVIRLLSNLGTNFEWSRTEADVVYSLTNRRIYKITPSTNTSVILRDLSLAPDSFTSLNKGGNEGTMDDLNKYMPINGLKNGVMNIGYYEIATNTIVTKELPFFSPNGGTYDWNTMLPSGFGMVVCIVEAAGPKFALYDMNLNFERYLSISGINGDIGYDTAGNEVLIKNSQIGYEEIFDSSVVVNKLSDTYSATMNNDVPMIGYTSTRCFKRPGRSYHCSVNGYRELFSLLLDNTVDGACTVERWGFARLEVASTYENDPIMVPSPSGTKIMYSTQWPGQTEINSYVVEVVRAATSAFTMEFSDEFWG